jgi:hypothetical protein
MELEVFNFDISWVKIGSAILYVILSIFGLILGGYIVYSYSRLQMKAWMDEFFKHIKENGKKEENQFQEQDRESSRS